MDHHQFRLQHLGHDDLVEIRIVMPNPFAVPTECTGQDARKRIAKWVLSSAVGLAASCGVDLQNTLHGVFRTLGLAIDQETWRALVLDRIRKEPVSPRELEENPPEGVSAHVARIIAQQLLDTGVTVLDEDLRYTVRIN